MRFFFFSLIFQHAPLPHLDGNIDIEGISLRALKELQGISKKSESNKVNPPPRVMSANSLILALFVS